MILRFKFYTLFFCLSIATFTAKAQVNNTDTIPKKIIEQSINDTGAISLIDKVETFTQTLNNANNILKRGFDSSDIIDKLAQYERTLIILNNNLVNNKQNLNSRNLLSTKVILVQIKKQLREWQVTMAKYNHKLFAINTNIKSITNDSSFIKTQEDSLLLMLYIKQVRAIDKKWKDAERQNTSAIKKIGSLQNRVTTLAIGTNDLLDEVEYLIRLYNKKILSQDEPFLWQLNAANYKNSFDSVLIHTYKRSVKILEFYLSETTNTRLWNIGIALFFFVWFYYNVHRLKRSIDNTLYEPVKYLLRSTLISAWLILFAIAPFLYDSPPALYAEILWLGMLLCATFLSWHFYSKNLKIWWILSILIFIIYGLDTVLIEDSLFERWLMLSLNIFTIVLGYFLFLETKKNIVKYPKFQNIVIGFYIGLNALALITNIAGRFALSKLLANASTLILSLSLSLHVIVELIIEALYLQLEVNKSSLIPAYLEFNEVKNKFKNVLIVVAFIMLILAFAWSINLYDFVVDDIYIWVNYNISIGSISFTPASILLFIAIIWISSLLASLLTFFFNSSAELSPRERKGKYGSWVLLVKLFIYIVGFLIAIGAAGIPLDKITIIIGALGVGIGFGLQNIVNNLVSGIILAFEKPMEIGDVIEIGNKTGTIKEMGIRSSKISTYDGADIIIPNGEFLSQHLTNWTHSNTHRRIELLIGVDYKTDIGKLQNIIQQILNEHDEILLVSHPPKILIQEFAQSAITIRVLFWTADFDDWIVLKSAVLNEILVAFRQQNINIPFPQRDIYIKSDSDNSNLKKAIVTEPKSDIMP
ncbi:MAG: mechanosensitive ion channel [Pedobacter sp.]|nr:mechanosensitive ion channel [Chitinophagaceae bacterium]